MKTNLFHFTPIHSIDEETLEMRLGALAHDAGFSSVKHWANEHNTWNLTYVEAEGALAAPSEQPHTTHTTMKPQTYIIHPESPAKANPISRDRIAYLFRAARSRSKGNIVPLGLARGRAIKDTGIIIFT